MGFGLDLIGCTMQEIWIATTDCTVNTGCIGAPVPTNYAPFGSGSGFVPQWTFGLDCLGYCATPDNQTVALPVGPLPVPVNVTLAFSVGGAGNNAPITSVILTE